MTFPDKQKLRELSPPDLPQEMLKKVLKLKQKGAKQKYEAYENIKLTGKVKYIYKYRLLLIL